MQPRSAETCSALCSAGRRGNRCPSRTGRTQEIRPAPTHLQDRRRRRTSLRRGFRESPGHHCGPRSPRSRNRRAGSWRVLWFCLYARPDASSKRCHGPRTNALPRSQPGRHSRSAATQAARWNGYVGCAGAPVPCLPATRAHSRHPQPERGDRGASDSRRAHRRLRRPLWRVVDFHYHVSRYPGPVHEYQFSLGPIGVGSLSFHLAQPVPLHAGLPPGAGDYDEPEPSRCKGSPAR